MKTVRFSIFVLLLFFLAVSFSKADENKLVISHDMQYGYANSLMEEKDFGTAIVEFKRFIHFFPRSNLVPEAQFNAARCRFFLKEYKQAARALNDIILEDRDPEITSKAVFLQSRAFASLGNTGYAKLGLQNYLKLTESDSVRDKIYFNLSMLHIGEAAAGSQEALDPAKTYLDKISLEHKEIYQVPYYIDLISRAEHAPQKNPTAAGLFAVVPGGGFLYCERYKDALVTFLLNAGLMIGAYQAWDNDNEALAGVIAFVETGFYTANIYGSISSAHKYNRAQVRNILGTDFHLITRINPENKGMDLEIALFFPF